MYRLDSSVVLGWNSESDGRTTYYWPGSARIYCSSCEERGIFTFGNHLIDRARHTVSIHGPCPGCNVLVNVWAVNAADSSQRQSDSCEVILIYPAPAQKRQPINGLESMPPRIQKAYRDALTAFNIGTWSISMAGSRVVLEGLIKEVYPTDTGSLYKKIEQMIQHADLKAPLLQLAHAVREGGNLGAHFDDEHDPDKEIAQATLDLIEYFLEYVYTLPEQARKLNERINGLENE